MSMNVCDYFAIWTPGIDDVWLLFFNVRAISLPGFGVDFLVIDVCNDHQELFLSESASMATWLKDGKFRNMEV